ncbi:hypothetical protein PG985_003715 [Apiospora marii]|uniref:uncharacterized protein n=1 Tax=Apiospora marii TaxID=335849 RepID=UPI00312E6094
MRNPGSASQHGIIPGDQPSRGLVQYDSISSNHSQPHVANSTPEISHVKRGYGVIRSRPADLDSLQDLPPDWQEHQHSTQYLNDEPNTGPGGLPKSWQPFWLRRSTLIFMSMSFIVLAALVLGLYTASIKSQGLGSTSSSNSVVYLWRYLPTTVTVILLAAWNGIDFSIRLLQPWVNLRRGSRSAESTLLLDFLTPILPVMMWTASKIKAWPPLLTIVSVLVLNIIVETVSMTTEEIPLLKTTSFDASKLDRRINDYASGTIYYGIQAMNLPWPAWTFGNVTLEQLSPDESTGAWSSTSFNGTTRGFFPSLECEEASVLITNTTDPRDELTLAETANITFRAPSCEYYYDVYSLVNILDEIEDKNYGGSFRSILCPDQTPRYLASVVLVDRDLKLLSSRSVVPTDFCPECRAHIISALFCRPSYFVQNVTVSVALPEGLPTVDWSTFEAGTAQLEHLEPIKLLDTVVSSAIWTSKPFIRPPNNTAVIRDDFLQVASSPLIKGGGEMVYLEPFLNTTVMAAHLHKAFAGMASLYVQKYLLSATREPVRGTSAHEEARVQVSAGSAFSIGGLLVLCALLSLLLLGLHSRGVVPRDPRSIGGVGIILHSSHELHRRCGLGLQQLQDSVKSYRLSSHVSPGPNARFVVDIDNCDLRDKHQDFTADSSKIQRAWQPTVLTTWCRFVAIVVPLLFIAALEYIQRVSDQQNGFLTISKVDSVSYSITIIPVVAMWAVGALYASMNFNTLLLSPYQAMSRYGAEARPGILSHNLGRLPLVSLFASLRDRHTAACFSALGTILGSFLTIAVAGLYSTASIDVETIMTVHRTDSFGLTWNGNPFQDGGASQVLSLNIWQNLSYPPWTYEDLAFPRLVLDESYKKVVEAPGRMDVSVPARRAVLECDVAEPERITVQAEYSEYSVDAEFQSRCLGSPNKFQTVPLRLRNSNLTGFGGQVLPLAEKVGRYIAVNPSTAYHAYPEVNDEGCHSLVLYYGSFPADPRHSTRQVDVRLSLLLPDGERSQLTIDPHRAPVPDEATARFVNDGPPGSSNNVQEYIVGYILSPGSITSDPDVQRRLDALPNLDGLYRAIIVKGGIDPGDLVGPENAGRLVQATSKMYGRYMAQAMNLIMRSTDNLPPVSQRTFSANVTQPQTRLHQNARPKLVLQILLGLMSACAVAGWLAMRDTRLLPHEPGSIAGMAALLAGSGLWDDGDGTDGCRDVPLVPEGAEWMNDEELIKAGRWDANEEGIVFGFGPRADGSVGVNVIRRCQTARTDSQELQTLGGQRGEIGWAE